MAKEPKEVGISDIAAKLDDLHGRLSAIEAGVGNKFPGGPITDPAPFPWPSPWPRPNPFPWPWPWPGPFPGPGPGPVDPAPWDWRGQLISIQDLIAKLRDPIFDPAPIDFSRLSKEQLLSQLHQLNASKVKLDASIAQIEKQIERM